MRYEIEEVEPRTEEEISAMFAAAAGTPIYNDDLPLLDLDEIWNPNIDTDAKMEEEIWDYEQNQRTYF